jgi:hypothetical protein
VVDENEYRDASEVLSRLPCPFSKAILTRCCGCERSLRLNLAEREVVDCASADAQITCLKATAALQRNARFALKLLDSGGRLPHAKAMKLQCGGLLGLRDMVFPERTGEAQVANIHGLIRAALDLFGRLEDVPFGPIVQRIAAYEGRPKHRSRDR